MNINNWPLVIRSTCAGTDKCGAFQNTTATNSNESFSGESNGARPAHTTASVAISNWFRAERGKNHAFAELQTKLLHMQKGKQSCCPLASKVVAETNYGQFYYFGNSDEPSRTHLLHGQAIRRDTHTHRQIAAVATHATHPDTLIIWLQFCFQLHMCSTKWCVCASSLNDSLGE